MMNDFNIDVPPISGHALNSEESRPKPPSQRRRFDTAMVDAHYGPMYGSHLDLPPISTHSLNSEESCEGDLDIFIERLHDALASTPSAFEYKSLVVRPENNIPLAEWEAKYSALEEMHEKERLARELRARMSLSQVLNTPASGPDLATFLVSTTSTRPQEEPAVQNGILNETNALPTPSSPRPTTPVEMAPLVATTGQIQIMLAAFICETRYFITPTGHYVRPDPAEIIRTLRGELLDVVSRLDKATESEPESGFGREPFEMWYKATEWTNMLLKALENENWSRDTVITSELLEWLKYVWLETQKQAMTIRHYLEGFENVGSGRPGGGPFQTTDATPGASGSSNGSDSGPEIGVPTNQNAQPSNRGAKLSCPYQWSDIRTKSNGGESADSRIEDPAIVETIVNTKRRREDPLEDNMAARREPGRRGTCLLMDEDGERMAKRAQENSKTE